MEVGIAREGSNARTLDRRRRRKASKARKEAAKGVATVTELVTAEGKLPFIPGE